VTPMRDHPRFIYRRGRGLLPVPVSPMAFVRSRLLSWRAKLRLLREPFLIGSPRGEESVASFAERHLGREMAETFIAPFVSGIYAGDPRQMSLPGALPRMRALAERGHGSLVRGAISKMLAERRAASGPPRRPSSSWLARLEPESNVGSGRLPLRRAREWIRPNWMPPGPI